MKTRFFALLLCLLFLPSFALAGAYGTMYVNNPQSFDRLNLRDAPDGTSLGKFYNGTKVEVLSETGRYSRVQVGTLTGYMESSFLSAAETTWEPGRWGIVNVEGTGRIINLRKSADAKSIILGTYPNGTAVQILGESGNFYQVRTVDLDGYMQKNLLVLEGEGARTDKAPIANGTILNRNVNLRSFPSRNGTSMLQLKQGTRVFVMATCGPWYYIITPYGPREEVVQHGFVLGTQLELFIPVFPDGVIWAVVRNGNESDRLHLRESPSTAARSFGRLFNETQVVVLEKNGTWWRVRLTNGQEGYMESRFLQEMSLDNAVG